MTPSRDARSHPLATWADGIFLSAWVVGALWVAGSGTGPAREVVLRSPSGVRREALVPGTLTVAGALGPSTVEVDPGGGVRFTSSPCPGKDCIRMGRIASAGAALACLPNRVVVELEGGGGPVLDAVSR